MADKIQYYTSTCPTNTTLTTLTLVDKYDQLQILVPNVSTTFSSTVVLATLKGTPLSGVTSRNANYYDYIGGAPKTCCVTISTGGVYEFPYPGALQYVQVQFDTPVSNVTNIYLMIPKTTY